MKHTKGPWELSEGNTSVWGKSPFNARVRLADIRKHAPANGIDHEANARLIAAAPEMLEALKMVTARLKAFDHATDSIWGITQAKVQAAIDKAEGGSK